MTDTITISKDEYEALKADAERYKREIDALGAYTVKVYSALDNLLENAEECEHDDQMAKVAPIECWDELDEALNEHNLDQAIDERKHHD